jgi:hypothetical protein
MADMQRQALKGLMLAAMGLNLASCQWISKQIPDRSPKVHTDVAFLQARLALPPTIMAVRWIAVTEHYGNSLLPGGDGVFIYASISLTQSEWDSLDRGTKHGAEVATLKAPENLWQYILPPEVVAKGRKAENEWAITGVAVDARPLLRDSPKLSMKQVARVGDALVMEFFEHD